MLNLLATEPDLPAWLEKALNNNSTISTQPPSQQTPTATALTSQDTASPSSVFTPVPAGIVITALPAIVTATSGMDCHVTYTVIYITVVQFSFIYIYILGRHFFEIL